MTRGALLSILATAFVLGCSCKRSEAPQPQPPAAAPSAPAATPPAQPAAPAPKLPAGWKITSDIAVMPAVAKQIAGRLGGELAALRNTVYEVDGKRVQLNTMRAADATSAATIVERLRKMKHDRFILRSGLTIYEFVGKDDAIPAMEAGRRHLEGAGGE